MTYHLVQADGADGADAVDKADGADAAVKADAMVETEDLHLQQKRDW